MGNNQITEWTEDLTEQVCETCGAVYVLVGNGSRLEVELVCDCRAVGALS